MIGKLWIVLCSVAWAILLSAVIFERIRTYNSSYLGFVFVFFGAVFLIVSKIPFIKKKKYFTFGYHKMTNKMALVYFVGYVFQIIGVLLLYSLKK